MFKKLTYYLIRWQLSTPILAPVIAYFKHSSNVFGVKEDWIGSAVANLIGGLIFFWVDKLIFKGQSWYEIWQTKSGKCDYCDKEGTLWRLVKTPNYDKLESDPIFLCKEHSKEKCEELKRRGINVK